MRIEGSVALVTGAASGLGHATARRLSSLGARVVGADLDGAAVRAALEDLSGAVAVACDVADADAVAAAVAAAEEVGPLRIAVNCAGTGLPPGRTVARDGSMQELEPWRQVVDVNLVGAYDVARQAAAAIARQEPLEDGGRGVIVQTSSIAGLDGSLGVSAYAASKGALASLVHSLARDLSIWGIRVLAVAPGPFDTPMFSGMSENIKAKRNAEMVFPKRPGKPEEFAFFVQHMVENDYLNADCFRLDAGLRMHE